MNKYIVVAGSSHHNALFYLKEAHRLISAHRAFTLLGSSIIYKNASKYSKINRLYLNKSFAILSFLEPLVFYRELKVLENYLGRIRSYNNAARTLDLDLVIANFNYKKSNFCVPHIQAFKRSFFVVLAIEALMKAHWPIPIALSRAQCQKARSYMVACP